MAQQNKAAKKKVAKKKAAIGADQATNVNNKIALEMKAELVNVKRTLKSFSTLIIDKHKEDKTRMDNIEMRIEEIIKSQAEQSIALPADGGTLGNGDPFTIRKCKPVTFIFGKPITVLQVTPGKSGFSKKHNTIIPRANPKVLHIDFAGQRIKTEDFDMVEGLLAHPGYTGKGETKWIFLEGEKIPQNDLTKDIPDAGKPRRLEDREGRKPTDDKAAENIKRSLSDGFREILTEEDDAGKIEPEFSEI